MVGYRVTYGSPYQKKQRNTKIRLRFSWLLAPFAIACLTAGILLLRIRVQHSRENTLISPSFDFSEFNYGEQQEFKLRSQRSIFQAPLQAKRQGQGYWLQQKSEKAPGGSKESSGELAKILYFLMITVGEEKKALRLLKRIRAPQNIYMVHLDQKIKADYRKRFTKSLVDLNESDHNIHLMHSFFATYKGITLVDQELTAMALTITSNMSWTHFINISPSSYPLFSQQDIGTLLSSIDPHLSFMSMRVADCSLILKRFTHIYYDLGLWGYSSKTVMESKQRVPVPKDLKIFKALQWKVLSRQLAEYLVISTDGWARRMYAFFAMTLIPDEHFEVTTACNSPLINGTIRNAKLHYMNWDNIDWGKRKGKLGPNPMTLETLEEAFLQGALFARKFDDTAEGRQALDMIDQLIDEGQVVINETVYTHEAQYNNAKAMLQQVIDNGSQCQQLYDQDEEQPCVSQRLQVDKDSDEYEDEGERE
eukprot:TRINITY_DN3056_c0_g1_i1.p1 TRINITY_DN3056_c0_g1~~TRINITY_DN3056_c0_g1_i1.p1  ORF type:complete len:478 (+),score=53.21 TRINITY_DN3056_c0_g1_i1:88-1521(+)